ncbi:protein NEDD1 [Protopterus annectens]|uniref:protein NEDD1 n=1 Tax=Protopterus annectens TaxID=7888 RepID=UPI001CFBBD12|nr:protein NEDD1 [Protopterus annectens]
MMQESIRLASAGDDIKIWDSSGLTVVEQFNPHSVTAPVSSVCWTSNNSFLVSASSTGDKIVVSSCKSKPVPLLELGDGKKQACIHLNSTSQYILSGGLDGTVNVWDLKTKKSNRSLKDHKDEVTCVSYNGRDSYLASGSASGEIILHSITTNLSSAPFGQGGNQAVRDLRYSFFKKALFGTVSDNGTVVLWDANTQSAYHIFDIAHKAPASGLCFSPVNDLLFITVGLDKRVICYDTASKLLLKTQVVEAPLTSVDIMYDGITLALGSSRGKIYLFDLRMMTSPLKTASAHKTSVKCLKFHNSTNQIKVNGAKVPASKAAFSHSSVGSRKSTVKPSAVIGSIQNIGGGRDIASHTAAVQQASVVPEGKGLDTSQEKIGLPHSTSLDVIPSKESEVVKNVDNISFKSFDSFGRNSITDMFSPLREDAEMYKPGEDASSRGDGLEFLSHLGDVLPTRKNPIGASTQETLNSSPLLIYKDSPLNRTDEETREQYITNRNLIGKQEPIDLPKQHGKLSSSSSDSANSYITSVSSTTKTPDTSEKIGRNVTGHLLYDSPINTTSTPNPRTAASIAAGVASSLSEKIADTIGNDGSGAPLSSVQLHFIKNMIQDTLEDFREAWHRDIVNLQLEMIKQFQTQLNDVHTLLERYSVNESLVAEIEKLREENKKLRTSF